MTSLEESILDTVNPISIKGLDITESATIVYKKTHSEADHTIISTNETVEIPYCEDPNSSDIFTVALENNLEKSETPTQTLSDHNKNTPTSKTLSYHQSNKPSAATRRLAASQAYSRNITIEMKRKNDIKEEYYNK